MWGGQGDDPRQGSSRTNQRFFPHIQAAIDQAGPNLEATTKANAKIQAALLRESSTVISGMVKEGKVKVVAGYYDVGTGAVIILD